MRIFGRIAAAIWALVLALAPVHSAYADAVTVNQANTATTSISFLSAATAAGPSTPWSNAVNGFTAHTLTITTTGSPNYVVEFDGCQDSACASFTPLTYSGYSSASSLVLSAVGFYPYLRANLAVLANGSSPTLTAVYRGAVSQSMAATGGLPFSPPVATSLNQIAGAPVLLGPGPSNVPGVGVSPRFSLANDSNAPVTVDDTRPHFSCSATFTPTATNAVTLVTLQGSATRTIRVTKFLLSGYATALSNNVMALQRTSALGSGGTIVAPTIAAADSRYGAAATATCQHYTSTLKAAGVAIGGPAATWLQFQGTVTTPATAVMAPQQIWPIGGIPGPSFVLRGTAEILELQNITPANLASGSLFQYTIEWVEDNS